MTRLQADLLLLLAAMIWGAAFVAQKGALEHVGSAAFVAARFFISFLVILPLAWREKRRAPETTLAPKIKSLSFICLAFFLAIMLQQWGIARTTITNAGFLTGLYAVFVPVIGWLIYRHAPSVWIYPAAVLSILGTWLLSGGITGALGTGDLLVILCAIFFALHMAMIGRLSATVNAPFQLSCLQYAAVALLAAAAASVLETTTVSGLLAAGPAILYAGAISGGVAYTIQFIAQRHTPSSDTAIILSSESVFAAIAGIWIMGDVLTMRGAMGCAAIILAILLVELGPRLKRQINTYS